MKKIMLFIFLILLTPVNVFASEHIYQIDMSIYIDEDGTAYITEKWDAQSGSKNKQWCKIFTNLESSKVQVNGVLMDEQLAEFDPDDELKEASYEVKYVTGGTQLCFGYKDTERHLFMLDYVIEDYIVNTEDSQILYHVFVENVTTDMFYVDIGTYYAMPKDIGVKVLGYDGNYFVDAGKVVLSNSDGLEMQYAATLIKFPKDTFKTENTNDNFNSYDDALNHSENLLYQYSDFELPTRFTFIDFIFVLLSIFVVILIIEYIVRRVTGKSLTENKYVKPVIKLISNFFKTLFSKIKKLISKINNK